MANDYYLIVLVTPMDHRVVVESWMKRRAITRYEHLAFCANFVATRISMFSAWFLLLGLERENVREPIRWRSHAFQLIPLERKWSGKHQNTSSGRSSARTSVEMKHKPFRCEHGAWPCGCVMNGQYESSQMDDIRAKWIQLTSHHSTQPSNRIDMQIIVIVMNLTQKWHVIVTFDHRRGSNWSASSIQVGKWQRCLNVNRSKEATTKKRKEERKWLAASNSMSSSFQWHRHHPSHFPSNMSHILSVFNSIPYRCDTIGQLTIVQWTWVLSGAMVLVSGAFITNRDDISRVLFPIRRHSNIAASADISRWMGRRHMTQCAIQYQHRNLYTNTKQGLWTRSRSCAEATANSHRHVDCHSVALHTPFAIAMQRTSTDVCLIPSFLCSFSPILRICKIFRFFFHFLLCFVSFPKNFILFFSSFVLFFISKKK